MNTPLGIESVWLNYSTYELFGTVELITALNIKE